MIEVVPAEQLAGTLDTYRCVYDDDIENFLRTKAITYENRGWCSTYLLVDEDKLAEQGNLFVAGYFTLSNKVMRLSETVSHNRRKKLFNGLKKDDNYMHFILIGQLGKHISTDEGQGEKSGAISAIEMLDKAFEIIYQVKERITCSCVLIECKDEPKIRKIYEEYGFLELQRDEKLIQYFMIL
ncbi:MAG: hypothetical protein NC434_08880 [Ruminococcus sp.]|nr:hypothetical protein [Ruminococcus sp.]